MMNKLKLFLIIIITTPATMMSASPMALSHFDLLSPPSRVIRTCCAFGRNLKMSGVPFLRYTDVTSLDQIGNHVYLGDKWEGNGLIYTSRGGFIDIGHLRDQADWTAYLYAWIMNSKNQCTTSLDLGVEGGRKILELDYLDELSEQDAIILAGRVAYDLSVWHEIATWHGASLIPFVPERYSSFSVEDLYSNLLGVEMGMLALQSDLPFEDAMTSLLQKELNNLGVVKDEMDTHEALEAVRGIWWTDDKKLPSAKILLDWQTEAYYCLEPRLIQNGDSPYIAGVELEVNQLFEDGRVIDHFYNLHIKLNYKFPWRKLFPDQKEAWITQLDFDYLIQDIQRSLRRESFSAVVE